MSDADVDPENVHFRYEPPYHPALSAEQIARIEQDITEQILRPLLREEYEVEQDESQ